MTDPRFGDDLQQTWDAVRRGEVPRAAVDPWLVETLRTVLARDHVPAPDPLFVQQVREELMTAATMTTAPDLFAVSQRNGHIAASASPTGWSAMPSALKRHPWTLARLATAALLLLTLASSFLAFGPGRLGRLDNDPAILPAIFGTPAPAETGITELLLDTTVAALPEGRMRVAVDRWRLQPSPAAVTLPAHEGVVMITVDAGEITVTADGIDHRLAAGDALEVTDQEFAFRASGSEAAIAYVTYVGPELSANRLWKSGDPLVHAHDAVISSSADELPGGTGRIALERITLPVGSSLPSQEASSLDWAQVGSGVLGLTLEGERLPFRWESGAERKIHQFGREPIPFLAPGTVMKMRNAGEDPLVLYRLTITPREAGYPAPRR